MTLNRESPLSGMRLVLVTAFLALCGGASFDAAVTPSFQVLRSKSVV